MLGRADQLSNQARWAGLRVERDDVGVSLTRSGKRGAASATVAMACDALAAAGSKCGV